MSDAQHFELVNEIREAIDHGCDEVGVTWWGKDNQLLISDYDSKTAWIITVSPLEHVEMPA